MRSEIATSCGLTEPTYFYSQIDNGFGNEIESEGRTDIQLFDQKLEEWNDKKIVRIVRREVPSSILPDGIDRCFLSDISVNARGPDDAIFKKHQDLRSHMRRGLTKLECFYQDGSRYEDYVISANRKFFECDVFDLSDTNLASNFIKNPFETSEVIAMEKVNGEAAHFSARIINGETFLIAGSKNVHLIFQTEEHINQYIEQRYEVAKDIALTVLSKWNQLLHHQQNELAKFLHEEKCTVFCEILRPDSQHVVNIENQDVNEIYILALTTRPTLELDSLTAMNPLDTKEMFESYGFKTAQMEALDLGSMNENITEVRNSTNTEGVVYYFQDSDGHTIGMLKYKSSWYTYLRALREQAAYRYSKNGGTVPLEQSKARSRKRISEIQKWLGTEDAEVENWKERSDKWFDWIETETTGGRVSTETIKTCFPKLWRLNENSLSYNDY